MDCRLAPIRSLRTDEPDLEPEIDAFVASLGERVDAFQDAQSVGDFARLEELAASLRNAGAALGYPAAEAVASAVLAACADKSMHSARKAVEDLTEIAQRMRRGHRSSAF